MTRYVAVLALMVGWWWVTPASAQVTTSTLRGTVRAADDNAPMAEAFVTLIHEPSGNVVTTTTNDAGVFVFTNLRVGGPYYVKAEAMGFAPVEAKNIQLQAGRTRDISLAVRLEEEVIEVSGTAITRNTSGRTVITAAEINQLPSVSRDPRDLVRRNPEAIVEGTSKSLSVGGANNRFNSVTVDGIRQDDDFGLNSSGYPTRRSPVALSAIEELAVESSPFDVRFGKFLGGNVNIVTKSGTNEFKGQLVGTYTSDALAGSKSRDNEIDLDFREVRYGATLGGPIYYDKLHFLASVEGLDAATPVSVGAAGSGAANEVAAVSQADLEAVQRIARDVYGFDAGVPSRNLDESDLKLLGKIDWAASKVHRVTATGQRTAGNTIQNGTATDRNLPLSSNWYNAKDTMYAASGRLFSTWSDAVSTQLELSGKTVKSRVPPLNGNGFMAARVDTADGGSIFLGPDEFRHANELDNTTITGKGEINYLLGKHLITGGLMYERLAIRNLFVPQSNGVAIYASPAAFEARMPTSIAYSNATSLNPEDAESRFHSGTATAYLQDQFKLLPELTIQGGVRFEYYRMQDGVYENQNFVDRHGFSNTGTLAGRHIAMPRLGISYLVLENLNLRGGAGLYSGGTPTVWVSNSFSNDGVRLGTAFSNMANVVAGFDGREIPQGLLDRVSGGNGNVDAMDPDFKIPSVWKVGMGVDYSQFGAELKLNYTFSKTRHGVMWKDLRRNFAGVANNTPVGSLPDGRPLYDTDMAGGRFDPRRGYDMLLTNTSRGYGHVGSLVLSKGWDFGLFLAGSYTYQWVQEVSPANSSRSVSSYALHAVVDPQRPDLATSDYERRHRLTATVEYSHPLVGKLSDSKPWKDMKTSVGMFVESRSGAPFSWTFGEMARSDNLARIFGEENEFARRGRQLFYVPKGDDSDVILMGIDPAAFDQFLEDTGLSRYRGQIAPRNAFRSPWFSKWDLRIGQDLPNPLSGHRAQLVLDFENVGNMLNDKWGRVSTNPILTQAVDVSYDAASGRYVYSNLRPASQNRVDVFASVWKMSIGLIYDF